MDYDRWTNKATIVKVSLRDAVNELKLNTPIRSVMRYDCNGPYETFLALVDDTIFVAVRSDDEEQS